VPIRRCLFASCYRTASYANLLAACPAVLSLTLQLSQVILSGASLPQLPAVVLAKAGEREPAALERWRRQHLLRVQYAASPAITTASSASSPFAMLPQDVLRKILQFSMWRAYKPLRGLRLVCKRFNAAVTVGLQAQHKRLLQTYLERRGSRNNLGLPQGRHIGECTLPALHSCSAVRSFIMQQGSIWMCCETAALSPQHLRAQQACVFPSLLYFLFDSLALSHSLLRRSAREALARHLGAG
jgi:hypothetical protein